MSSSCSREISAIGLAYPSFFDASSALRRGCTYFRPGPSNTIPRTSPSIRYVISHHSSILDGYRYIEKSGSKNSIQYVCNNIRDHPLTRRDFFGLLMGPSRNSPHPFGSGYGAWPGPCPGGNKSLLVRRPPLPKIQRSRLCPGVARLSTTDSFDKRCWRRVASARKNLQVNVSPTGEEHWSALNFMAAFAQGRSTCYSLDSQSHDMFS